jgi:hypothetical protein
VAVGNRLKAPDKTELPASGTAADPVIKNGPLAEFVDATPENPPRMAARESSGHRYKAIPENDYGNDN